MRAIKHVLTERFYAWEDAVKLAEKDPEVNLTGNGPAFTPSNYLEHSDATSEGEVAAEDAEGTTEKAESTATTSPNSATIPSPKAQTEAPRL